MSDYLTVKQMAEKHPAFTQRALRGLIANADENGFGTVIRRTGSKILLVETEFIKWIEGK